MKHNLKWFTDRIGKKVYRDTNDCCISCEDVCDNGIVINNQFKAEYLHMVNCEMDLNYRDNK